jgi:hypothetical protein
MHARTMESTTTRHKRSYNYSNVEIKVEPINQTLTLVRLALHATTFTLVASRIHGVAVMSTFYIPYCENQSSDWRVVEKSKTRMFHSRREALIFAIDKCREASAMGDSSAVISIEGYDGQWRSFDSRLLPVSEEHVSPASMIDPHAPPSTI